MEFQAHLPPPTFANRLISSQRSSVIQPGRAFLSFSIRHSHIQYQSKCDTQRPLSSRSPPFPWLWPLLPLDLGGSPKIRPWPPYSRKGTPRAHQIAVSLPVPSKPSTLADNTSSQTSPQTIHQHIRLLPIHGFRRHGLRNWRPSLCQTSPRRQTPMATQRTLEVKRQQTPTSARSHISVPPRVICSTRRTAPLRYVPSGRHLCLMADVLEADV